MSDIRDLYQEVIIDHGRHPRNFGAMKNASHQQEGFNPLCGDKVTVYVKMADKQIESMQFDGCGCAISMASASLLSQMVKGKSLSDLQRLFSVFHLAVTTSHDEDVNNELGKLAVLTGVREYPARVKCAMLVWYTLLAAMEGSDKTVTTE